MFSVFRLCWNFFLFCKSICLQAEWMRSSRGFGSTAALGCSLPSHHADRFLHCGRWQVAYMPVCMCSLSKNTEVIGWLLFTQYPRFIPKFRKVQIHLLKTSAHWCGTDNEPATQAVRSQRRDWATLFQLSKTIYWAVHSPTHIFDTQSEKKGLTYILQVCDWYIKHMDPVCLQGWEGPFCILHCSNLGILLNMQICEWERETPMNTRDALCKP